MRSAIIAFLMTFVMLVGCSTVQDGSKALTPLGDLGIRIATINVIDEANNPLERAQRVQTITEKSIQFIDATTVVVVPELEVVLRKNINWDSLERDERILVEFLIAAIKVELEKRVDIGMLDANALFNLRNILQIVNDTAKMSLVQSNSVASDA